MSFDLQPKLEDDLVKLVPLQETDFERLYEIASDPLIWEQHPNPNRYQKAVFQKFFEGAIQSKSAFLITENANNKVIGSSRYYDFDEKSNSIVVGYTFIGRAYWGKGYNNSIKKLMFDYAFQFVERIMIHIGESNLRSQKAIEKIGAKKINQIEVAYYGEPVKTNFVYLVEKSEWQKTSIIK